MSGIVDLHGLSVSDLRVKGDSLTKGRQWVEYLDAHGATIAGSDPWVRFLLNGAVSFHQSFIILSRRLRKNRVWTGGATMAEEVIGLADDAYTRLAWFETHSEEIDQRGLPDWAKFLFVSLQGGLRMQVRLANEAEQIMRRGHLLIPVSRQGEVLEDSNEERPDLPGAARE